MTFHYCPRCEEEVDIYDAYVRVSRWNNCDCYHERCYFAHRREQRLRRRLRTARRILWTMRLLGIPLPTRAIHE